ncbi:hypothetical protein [Streptomyces sp. PA5.6]|uniref:hypothetical protein n=1 Tax=Streptomyces sp. PA5.6 TaxID=3035651 RepID=UPI003904B086
MDNLLGNLPGETSRLVGRRAELEEVARLCGRSRMVTVTGVGGVGKTRLTRRAAGELQPGFVDGAWWVGLSPLTAGGTLPYAIAEALPLADQTTRPMLEVIAEYLAGRQALLVWDTCEHLVFCPCVPVHHHSAAGGGFHVNLRPRPAFRPTPKFNPMNGNSGLGQCSASLIGQLVAFSEDLR